MDDPGGKCCTGMIPIPPLKKDGKTMNFVGVAGYNAEGVYYNSKYPLLKTVLSRQEKEELSQNKNDKIKTEAIRENNAKIIREINNYKNSSGTLSTSTKKKKENGKN